MKTTILNLKRAAAGLAVAAMALPAAAEIPAAGKTAMEAAAVDGAEMATLGLLVIIAIAAIKYLRGAK